MRSSIFTRNLGVKILALILSVALWWIVRQGEVTKVPVSPVRIVLTNVPVNMNVVNQSTQFVSISVRGPGNIVKDISKDNFQIEFDMKDVKVGKNMIPINSGVVRTLYLNARDENKIDVFQDALDDEMFVVTMERVEKSVAVEPDIYGEPNSRYSIKEIKVQPEKVVITGPEAKISKINTFKTESVDITNLSETLSMPIRVIAAPSDIKFVTPESGEVTITISLSRIN